MIFQLSKRKTKPVSGKNIQNQLMSQYDEFKMMNIIKEAPKLLDLHQNIAIRNDFLKAQKITNYQYEMERLRNIEKTIIPTLRYFPASKGGSYPDSSNRMEQLQLQINENIDTDYEHRPYKHLFNRYY